MKHLFATPLLLALVTSTAHAEYPHIVCAGASHVLDINQNQFDVRKFELDFYSDRENPNYESIVPGDLDTTIAALEGDGLPGQWDVENTQASSSGANFTYRFKAKRQLISTVVDSEAWNEALSGELDYNVADPSHSTFRLSRNTRCNDTAISITTGFGGGYVPPSYYCLRKKKLIDPGSSVPVACKLAAPLDPAQIHTCKYHWFSDTHVCDAADGANTLSATWKLGGIGVELTQVSSALGSIAIASVLPGSAADRAGLKAGDAVVKLQTEQDAPWVPLTGLDSSAASLLIRGRVNTPVGLEIDRLGQAAPITLTIIRAPLAE
jgi:hypothetical protein